MVRGLSLGYGGNPVQRDVSFDVRAGAIFAIMGVSGCGKSTLLKALIGLLRPNAGSVSFDGEDYWAASEERRMEMGRNFGVVFQGGALWTSMTADENVALPLQLFTKLSAVSIQALVQTKLSLVGLTEGRATYPAGLSGGMRQRVGLARALALEPQVLFLDEPSAGLDPISSVRLDDLILELRNGFAVTIVVISHELPSLFGICDDGVFLDELTHTTLAHGSPKALRDSCRHPVVRAFMHRELPGIEKKTKE